MILPGAAMGRVRPVLAALLLACVAVPVAASLAAPEIPLRTPEMLRSGATHVVTGTVQRVYLSEEQDGRWEVGEHVAELRVDGVEKAPAASGWSEEVLPDGPLYVRWTYRTFRRRWWWGDDTPPLSSSGHRGWTPEAGERVRVYLAFRAHDGFHSSEENGDGGFNVLHPNGFERLAPLTRGGPAKPGSADGARSPR